MNVIFMGAMVPADRISQMSGLSMAGNKFQSNLVKYLARQEDAHIYVLTALPLAPFPRDKRIKIKKSYKKIKENVEYYEIPYINIPIIKQLTQIRGYFSCAGTLVNKEPVLLSMNLYPHIGCAFLKLRRKYKLKGAAILADLPIDDNYDRKGIAKFLRNFYYGIAAQNIKKCHEFIVLNENAIKEYAEPSSRYLVMEGGVNPEEIEKPGDEETKKDNPDKKRIVFSGALTDYSGIADLMEAMKLVADERVVLEIYGAGKLAEKTAQIAAENDNIVFMGKVSNEEMLKIQRKAWLLVNPRPVEDPIARVTFPSKIFEYMISGTPVLTTKLNGFTEEYYDKMFFVDENSPSVLAEKISELAKMDGKELQIKAAEARKFVMEKKNWQCQTEKIYRFLADL